MNILFLMFMMECLNSTSSLLYNINDEKFVICRVHVDRETYPVHGKSRFLPLVLKSKRDLRGSKTMNKNIVLIIKFLLLHKLN